MTDLRARILERIDQLETVARAATGQHGWTGPWSVAPDPEPGRVRILAGPGDWEGGKPKTRIRDVAPTIAAHVAAWDPQAVLTLCAGARQIVELHDEYDADPEPTCTVCRRHTGIGDDHEGEWPCATLQTIARMLGIDPDGDADG